MRNKLHSQSLLVQRVGKTRKHLGLRVAGYREQPGRPLADTGDTQPSSCRAGQNSYQ